MPRGLIPTNSPERTMKIILAILIAIAIAVAVLL